MALQGDLTTMDVHDLLQWAVSSGATGRLVVRHRSGDVRLDLAAGSIVDVDFPGSAAWSRRFLSEEVWAKARAWAERERTTPEEILVRVGLLDAEAAQRFQVERARQALRTVQLWQEGWFRFEERPFGGAGVPVDALLLETAVEADERQRVHERFGEGWVWLEAAPGATLAGLEPALAERVRQGVHLVELPWLLGVEYWHTAEQLHPLVEAGEIAVLPVEEERVRDPVKVYQEAVIAQRRFQYEEAAERLEAAITSAWDDAFAGEMLERWLERYRTLVDQHLIPPQRWLRRAEGAWPAPGDPYAAFLLRRLERPVLRPALELAPFHRFFALRAIRRLAAGGALEVLESSDEGEEA